MVIAESVCRSKRVFVGAVRAARVVVFEDQSVSQGVLCGRGLSGRSVQAPAAGKTKRRPPP